MKRFLSCFLAILMVWGTLFLSSCDDSNEEASTTVTTTCAHRWKSATCTAPKTCVDCGLTEGEANEHSWKDATCTTPKKCSACGKTSGSSTGHSWKSATCTAPKTCIDCGLTSGNSTGHSWKSATCTTPKTCKDCGVKSGSSAGHSWKAATCTTPKTCITCGTTSGTFGHSWNGYSCESCGDSNEIIVEKTTMYQNFNAYSEINVRIVLPTITSYYKITDKSGNVIKSQGIDESDKTYPFTHKLEKGSYVLTFYYYLSLETKMSAVRGPNGSYGYEYVTSGSGTEYMGTCYITVT